MESVPWPVVGAGAGWVAFFTLAFLVLRAVIKGDWVHHSTLDRELEVKDHDANEWRTEGRIKDQMMHDGIDQLLALMTAQGVSLHNFLEALQQAGGPKQEGH